MNDPVLTKEFGIVPNTSGLAGITNGGKIGYTVGVEDLTEGVLYAGLYWIPVDNFASVSIGNGGAL